MAWQRDRSIIIKSLSHSQFYWIKFDFQLMDIPYITEFALKQQFNGRHFKTLLFFPSQSSGRVQLVLGGSPVHTNCSGSAIQHIQYISSLENVIYCIKHTTLLLLIKLLSIIGMYLGVNQYIKCIDLCIYWFMHLSVCIIFIKIYLYEFVYVLQSVKNKYASSSTFRLLALTKL